MNTDFKSLEKRYGTLLATKIFEEIARADQRRLSFYKLPPTLRAIKESYDSEMENFAHAFLPKTSKAA